MCGMATNHRRVVPPVTVSDAPRYGSGAGCTPLPDSAIHRCIAPAPISLNRSAAKAIISRRIPTSGGFSTRERGFIISSVIRGYVWS